MARRTTTLAAVLALAVGLLVAAPGRAAAKWVPALRIGPATASGSFGDIDVDRRGNAVAVWTAGNGIHQVHISFRKAGGSWTEPLAISKGDTYAPKVVLDDRGRVTVLWTRTASIPAELWATTRNRSGVWTEPVMLSGTLPLGHVPNLVLMPDGGVVTAFARAFAGVWYVAYAVKPPGGVFGPATDLSFPSATASGHVGLGSDAEGNVTAVWTRYTGSNNVIETSTRSYQGPWSSIETLSELGRDAVNPSVAVQPGGRSIAVWSRYDGSRYVAQASVRPGPGGAWRPPKDLSGSGVSVEATSVATSGSGRAVAVWDGSRLSGVHVVQAATRTKKGVWLKADTISDPEQNAMSPQVVMDGKGNATATWKRFNGTVDVATGAHQKAGRDFASPANLSTSTRNAYPPALAVDGPGDAVAFWVDSGETTFQARSKAFDRTGPRIRTLRVPLRVAPGVRKEFKVAVTDTWSSVASYRWRFGDGTGATGRKATHGYARVGTYTVTVTIKDSRGNVTVRKRLVRVVR
jgi:hypothetical protein